MCGRSDGFICFWGYLYKSSITLDGDWSEKNKRNCSIVQGEKNDQSEGVLLSISGAESHYQLDHGKPSQ